MPPDPGSMPEESRLRMDEWPILHTRRLLLRRFRPEDAATVQALAGDRDIASTTATIPHPYEDGVAEAWIATHDQAFRDGKSVILAITLPPTGELIGATGLEICTEHRRAELGYWVGKPYWNNGYCTEAAGAMLEYGFEVLGLDRIFAHHFTRNPASGRVMQKLNMKHEGHMREHLLKWGVREDLEIYGILRTDPRPKPNLIHP
ncbi:MAG: GNAT family N-acetyltransferase [Dehalococcoidia bacterium]|nr:GNAT family N-acetyltransferase [Dehalococcoidia bacterium]